MLDECEWSSQYQQLRRSATSHLAVVLLFLSTWHTLSGTHCSRIHPTAYISYTRFLPFKTKMVDVSAVSFHLQIYAVVFISFLNSGHLHHRTGQVAMYLTFVSHSLLIVLLTNMHTGYSCEVPVCVGPGMPEIDPTCPMPNTTGLPARDHSAPGCLLSTPLHSFYGLVV